MSICNGKGGAVIPYMKARSALVKVIFDKAKAKEVELSVPKSAKIIKKKQKKKLYKNIN